MQDCRTTKPRAAAPTDALRAAHDLGSELGGRARAEVRTGRAAHGSSLFIEEELATQVPHGDGRSEPLTEADAHRAPDTLRSVCRVRVEPCCENVSNRRCLCCRGVAQEFRCVNSGVSSTDT